jgi:CubicO group peptidase (beta-lactamase class C family)
MSAIAPKKESDPSVMSQVPSPTLPVQAELQVIDRGQRDRFAPAIAALEEAVRSGAIPGGVLGVVSGGNLSLLVGRGIRWSESLLSAHRDAHSGTGGKAGETAGLSSAQDEANQVHFDTIYDLGTLTSALVTVPLAIQATGAGKIRLEERVSRYLQGFGVHGKSTVTIEQLLCHAAGFPATAPFSEELSLASGGERIGILTTRGAKQFVYTALHRFEPRYVPGSKRVWSELSAIVLGEMIETVTGAPIDRLAQRELFQPLGLRSTSFVDLGMIKRRGISPVRDMIAPTEFCQWRRQVMCGEVFNENAWAMGGISGHAGVFASARDVCALALEFIRALNGRGSVLDPQTIHRFVAPTAEQEHGVRLGFESPSKENGLIESGLSPNSFGAISETGCCVWVDRAREIGIVLLTNRADHGRNNKQLKLARASITREVLSSLQ